MNTIQKIIDILMNPNAELTNIIIFLFFIVEVFIFVNMFTVLLNINPSKKIKYTYAILLFIITSIAKYIILVPFNTIFNILVFILLALVFFKTKLLDTCITLGIFFSINSFI